MKNCFPYRFCFSSSRLIKQGSLSYIQDKSLLMKIISATLLFCLSTYAHAEKMKLLYVKWQMAENRIIKVNDRKLRLNLFPPPIAVLNKEGFKLDYILCYSTVGFAVTPVTIDDPKLAAIAGNQTPVTGHTKVKLCNGKGLSGSIMVPKSYLATKQFIVNNRHYFSINIKFHGPVYKKTLELNIYMPGVYP